MDASYIEVADVGELAPNQMKAFEVDGKRLLLVLAEDRYYVIDEMCSHEDFSLALGCIKGNKIKCSLHGSFFDLESGEPLDEPADEAICTYEVKVEDNKIWAKIS